MPSVNPQSSARNAPITLARRQGSVILQHEDRATVQNGRPGIRGCDAHASARTDWATQDGRDHQTDDALLYRVCRG